MKKDWPTRPLSDFVTSKSGNSKIIKGTQSDKPADGLIQGFSASGPDVWVTTADYNQSGVVISAVGARCGKTFMADGQWTAIANTHVLLPGKDIDPRWLWYRTNDETFWIRGGSAQPFVKVKDTLQQLCKIPPLAEQQRIVGLLDEAFASLVTAKVNAEKNLQNARALFQSHLQSVFTQRGKGWEEKPMGEVCEVKDGTHDSPKYVEDGIPFVTQKNIREDGLSFEKTRFIRQEDHDDFCRRSNATHGDILISMIGANRGMACIVDDERTFSIKNVGLVKKNPSINHQFLLYFLKSPQAASYVQAVSKGGAQEFVGLTELRRFPVPLPSLERQNMLAGTFQSLREETQRLASLYERKVAALEALKKSLLHQAFTGNL